MKRHIISKNFVAGIATLSIISAYGALYNDYDLTWSDMGDPYIAGTGPDTGNPYDGQDIISVSYGVSATDHYFRMVLQGEPSESLNGVSPNFSGYYGIYIDADNDALTGSAGTSAGYIPDDLNGIEFILDSHYQPSGILGPEGFYRHDHHSYSSGSWNFRLLTAAEHEENGDVLEWSISKTDLSGEC